MCDSICELGAVPRELNPDDLRSEIDEFLSEFGTQDLGKFDLGSALTE